MKRIILIAVVTIIILFVMFVLLMRQMLRDSSDANNGQLPTTMINVNGRSILVELAADSASRTRGLSYRESLDPERGMLFTFGTSTIQRFWMYKMNFPLDIIFIDGETVVDVAANVPYPKNSIPAIVNSKVKADKVLEINAGKAEEWGISVGTSIGLQK